MDRGFFPGFLLSKNKFCRIKNDSYVYIINNSKTLLTMATLEYNNATATVTITMSNGSVKVEKQNFGWILEKMFIESKIAYISKTI